MATFNFALPQRIKPQTIGWNKTMVFGLPTLGRAVGSSTGSTPEVVASVFPTASKATTHPKRP